GLAPATVAGIRREVCPTAQNDQLNKRVGRDGRVRPSVPAAQRSRIEALDRKRPDSSLREVAAATGSSPETGPTGRQSRSASAEATTTDGCPSLTPVTEDARPEGPELDHRDQAFDSLPSGILFVDWFAANGVDEAWREWLHTIPLSRIYEIADECRKR